MSWIARAERDQLNYKSYLIARVTICTCETTGATLSLTRITEDKMKMHDRPYPNHSSYLPGVLEYQEPHHLHEDQGGPGKEKKKEVLLLVINPIQPRWTNLSIVNASRPNFVSLIKESDVSQ